MYTSSTPVLVGLLIAMGTGAHYSTTSSFNFSPTLEKSMRSPLVFGFLVLMQGVLGGKGLAKPPRAITKVFENRIVRFISLFAITLSGTRDIEVALSILGVFLVLMQLLRSPEERADHPYLI